MSRNQISIVVAMLLAGCAAQSPAPIVARSPVAGLPVPQAVAVQPTEGRSDTYVVRKGDTLFRIALDHGLAYRDLASWNGLEDVNDIKVDQVLRLTPPDAPQGVEVRPLRDAPEAASRTEAVRPVQTLAYPRVVKLPHGSAAAQTISRQADGTARAAEAAPIVGKSASAPAAVPSSTPATAPAKTDKKSASAIESASESAISWTAPVDAKLLKGFSDESKGVDFAGKMGQPVMAAAPGKVVYAGNGLRGYGKMIIIKHDSAYLSAYAHNSKLLVKEGDAVKRGEKIAEMGNTDTDQVKLHFEIRKFGKPVDPIKYVTADK